MWNNVLYFRVPFCVYLQNASVMFPSTMLMVQGDLKKPYYSYALMKSPDVTPSLKSLDNALKQGNRLGCFLNEIFLKYIVDHSVFLLSNLLVFLTSSSTKVSSQDLHNFCLITIFSVNIENVGQIIYLNTSNLCCYRFYNWLINFAV